MRSVAAWLMGDRRGAVAPTVALSLFGLIAAGGLAFDYARLAGMDTELQNAADQAALAAASQLDRGAGACARASAAAVAFVANDTRFSNDGGGLPVVITSEPDCDATGDIRFYSSYTNPATNTAADSDATARFVSVTANGREAVYALTPVVAALKSGAVAATAVAGLGSSICKVPPLMICNPTPGQAFNAANRVGQGIRVVAHQNGQSWSPGNFGFLNVGQANNGAPDLLGAMAYQNAALTCQSIDTGDVDPGATAPAIDAANTRFDIYNFGGGSGSTLGACNTGACPAAQNVTKDLVRPQNATGNNACKIHNQGWQLPAVRFVPRAKLGTDTALTPIANGAFDAMGLPRDNCHYDSYASPCTGGRIGDGKWARGDYFNKYHSTGGLPSSPSTITRYQTYRWEIDNNNMPVNQNAGGTLRQQGSPVCSSGALDPTRDRRVFTVAIANNCANLSGSSVPVQISEWVDMFFVEPGATGRGNGVTNDEIYLEVVRQAITAGDGTNAQLIRRDTPYLIE